MVLLLESLCWVFCPSWAIRSPVTLSPAHISFPFKLVLGPRGGSGSACPARSSDTDRWLAGRHQLVMNSHFTSQIPLNTVLYVLEAASKTLLPGKWLVMHCAL